MSFVVLKMLEKCAYVLLLLLLCATAQKEDGNWSNFVISASKHWLTGEFNLIVEKSDDDSSANEILQTLSKLDKSWQVMSGSDYVQIGHADPSRKSLTVILLDEQEQDEIFGSDRLQKDFWLVPYDMLAGRDVKSRFDSNIYLYDITEDGGADLYEVFSFKSNKFLNKLGRYTLEDGLVVENTSVWGRRGKFLKGIKLKGVHLAWPPFTFIEKDAENETKTYGVLPDLMKHIQVRATNTVYFATTTSAAAVAATTIAAAVAAAAATIAAAVAAAAATIAAAVAAAAATTTTIAAAVAVATTTTAAATTTTSKTKTPTKPTKTTHTPTKLQT